MCRRRILYTLALIAALLFQIFYDRYLARFVLASVVCLPVLSLLLSLPAALRLRLRLEGDGIERRRGAAGKWRLCVARHSIFPVLRVVLRVRSTNDLTGWTEKKRVVCADPLTEKLEFPVQADHCGRITCRVTRAWMLDCLGVFAIPVRRPVPAATLVLPVLAPAEELPGIELADAPAVTEGNQKIPNGDYELRDYRAGDPLRSVHWKLSSKRDKLVVREWQGRCCPQVILAVERFGGPERLDRVLDRFFALSMNLLEQDCPHLVKWEENGVIRTASIWDRESLLACMGEILSSRAPLQGTPIEELLPLERDIPCVYVTAGEEGAL